MATSPEEIKKHIKFYIGIFAALMVLTVITVLVSFVHIGPPDSMTANIIVGMIIATIKASLVAAFFMHLSTEKGTIYKIMIVSTLLVIGLFLLSILAFYDPIPALF